MYKSFATVKVSRIVVPSSYILNGIVRGGTTPCVEHLCIACAYLDILSGKSKDFKERNHDLVEIFLAVTYERVTTNSF